MTEALNSLFKGELVRNRGPWPVARGPWPVARGPTSMSPSPSPSVSTGTDHRRLQGEIGLVPPVEHEQAFRHSNTQHLTELSVILKQKIDAWARRCDELGITPAVKLSLAVKPEAVAA